MARKKNLLEAALDLPAFLLGVFCLYWSLPLSVLLGRVQFLKLYGKRDDAGGWSEGLRALFAVKVLQLPGPELYRGENVVYLANHRCWADFFLDVIMTDGRAQMLSRLAVLLVFPAFMLAVWVIKSVILFKRGSKIDKQMFNEMIDTKMRESPVQGLIVYPEGPRHGQAASGRVSAGHRSTRRDSLPLKRGMLHYCYDRNKTVQIVMTANKEAVLSEKDLRCHFGQTVLVGYAEPIHPTECPSFEVFMDRVQKTWDAEWQRIYSADWSRAKPKVIASHLVHEYPPMMKLLQIFFTGGSCVAFFVTMYWSVRGFAAFLSQFGAYKVVVTALLVIWCGISLARSFVLVRYPLAERPAPTS